jgi:hypothetical protein
MYVALAVFFIGAVLLGLCGISFRLRAITNKPAWNGATLPLLLMGLLFLVPGIILLAVSYAGVFGG